jgi:hypothetical protein
MLHRQPLLEKVLLLSSSGHPSVGRFSIWTFPATVPPCRCDTAFLLTLHIVKGQFEGINNHHNIPPSGDHLPSFTKNKKMEVS